MIKPLISFAAALAFAAPSFAQEETETSPSPNQIVDAASPEEWLAIPAEDLLVMTLAPDAEGNPREVVIQLIPPPFSQGWVYNVKLLSRSQYYDGLAVIRVQDNYVTQWGDPADEENAEPLPEPLESMAEEEYLSSLGAAIVQSIKSKSSDINNQNGANAVATTGMIMGLAPRRDLYAGGTMLLNGWPIATDNDDAWPTHCYGMVGVARGLSPNTGDGSSLYTVIGHAPRHLDRNIALVGRVIEGMEHLSSLPRGEGVLGFYDEDEADKRTPILTVRIASDLAKNEQPQFEYLSTESDAFAKYAEARANRRDPFFIHPAGGVDICNLPVPIRRAQSE